MAEEVKEEGARASVDELTKGLVETARQNGKLPPMRAIEDYAKDITKQSIAEIERDKVMELQDVKKGKAKLDDAEHGDVIEDEFGKVKVIKRDFDQKRADAYAAKQKQIPLVDQIEAQLISFRLTMLLEKVKNGNTLEYKYPEWAKRIQTTYIRVRDMSIKASTHEGMSPDELDAAAKQAASDGTDAVIKILDESSKVFGDWRDMTTKKLFFGPMR